MTHAIQMILILAVAPLVQGAMKMLRARLQGRPGPSPLQPYRDLLKLWQKEPVVPRASSWLVLAAPGLVLGVALTVAALVPDVFGTRTLGLEAIALALTLAVGRFILVLAALDTRSSFEGMAASREITFGALTEAPLIVALITLPMRGSPLAGVLACAAFLCVMLSETARMPVDNQETHYELTMIHEGLILEYGGWQLAILHYASYVRQAAMLLLAALFLSGSGFVTLLLVLALIAGIAVLERSVAKMRLFEVPTLFGSAAILALASLCMHILGGDA